MERINTRDLNPLKCVPFLQENKTKLNLVISNRIAFIFAKFLENLLLKNPEEKLIE